MSKIEDLQKLDMDQVHPDILKEQILNLLGDYENEQDKELFNREAGENISKLYDLVKKHSPEAIVSEFGKLPAIKPKRKRGKNKKKEKDEEQEKELKEKEEREKAEKEAQEKTQKELVEKENQEKEVIAKKALSKKAIEEIEEIGKEIESCRQVIREYNKRKKEAEGKEPIKKTRLTKLKEKLLGIAGLIPENLKEEKETRDKTEKILLNTLSELKKAWRLNLIKDAQKAIKEKFDELEEKEQKKEEMKAA